MFFFSVKKSLFNFCQTNLYHFGFTKSLLCLLYKSLFFVILACVRLIFNFVLYSVSGEKKCTAAIEAVHCGQQRSLSVHCEKHLQRAATIFLIKKITFSDDEILILKMLKDFSQFHPNTFQCSISLQKIKNKLCF